MTKVQFTNYQNFSYGVNNGDNNKFSVSGMAIHEGCFHGFIRIPPDEMENCANTLQGKKLFKNHEYTLDDIIGKVGQTEILVDQKNGKLGVQYDGYIDRMYDSIIYKIENNLIDSTSIGFQFEPYCSICGQHILDSDCTHWFKDDGFYVIAKQIEIFELSVVSLPADKDATVSGISFNKAQFNKQFKQQFKEKIENNDTKLKPKNLNKEEMLKPANFEVNETHMPLAEAITDALAQYKKIKLNSDKMENKEVNDSTELQKSLDSLNEKVKTLKEENENLTEKIASFEEQAEKNKKKLSEAELAKIEAQSDTKTLKEEVESLSSEILEMKEKFEDAKLSGLRIEVSELYKELTDNELEGVEEMDEEALKEKLSFCKLIQEKQASKKPKRLNEEQETPYQKEDREMGEKFRKEGKHAQFLGLKVQKMFENNR